MHDSKSNQRWQSLDNFQAQGEAREKDGRRRWVTFKEGGHI